MRYNDNVWYILQRFGRFWVRRNHRMVAGPFDSEASANAWISGLTTTGEG